MGSKSAEVSLRVTALDHLGSIAARLRKHCAELDSDDSMQSIITEVSDNVQQRPKQWKSVNEIIYIFDFIGLHIFVALCPKSELELLSFDDENEIDERPRQWVMNKYA